MYNPGYFILYVNDPLASSYFYQKLFSRQPVVSHPAFVVFSLPNNMMLGLWIKKGVKPEPAAPGGAEIAFYMKHKVEVDNASELLKQLNAQIQQPPEEMDFGYALTALDPDGHRLRFFTPNVDWDWLSPEKIVVINQQEKRTC